MTKQAKKRLTGLAVVVLVVAIAAGGWGLLSLSGSSDAAESGGVAGALEWYKIKRTDFDVKIIATGELEARNQIEVKSKVDGNNAIISVVDEGVTVQAGDLLVKLDDSQIVAEIEEDQIEVEQASANLLAAQRDLELAEQQAITAEKAAQVELNLARITLEKWRDGDVKQARRGYNLELVNAERELKTAERDLDLSRQLREQNFISQNELEDAELTHINAVDALETAKQNIEVYNKYIFEQERQQYESDVDQAEAGLDQVRRENQIKIDRAKSDVESKQRTLDLRQSRLDEEKQELANTTIRAPADGLVVYATSVGRGRRGNDTPIQQGREVREDETIILLPDTSQMVASLRVHEAVLNQIKLGQRAVVAIDARRDAPVEGKVYSVGVMAVDGGWLNPQLREYTVKVALPENYDNSLKPAMRCTGQIYVGRVENALAVPVQAVFTEGRRRFVYVSAGSGRVKRQPVTIGRASESLVEITEGVDEGTRVLLRNPRPGEVVDEPGTASRPTDPFASPDQSSEGQRPEGAERPRREGGGQRPGLEQSNQPEPQPKAQTPTDPTSGKPTSQPPPE